jgi:uncharacterized membrane-anchored protein YjiN (DUF445 family)
VKDIKFHGSFLAVFVLLILVHSEQVYSQDYLTKVRQYHQIDLNFMREIAVYRAKSTKNNDKIKTANDFKVIDVENKSIAEKIFQLYRKQYRKNFSKTESDYLEKLYNHELMKKIADFNKNFLSSSELKRLLEQEIDLNKK